MGSEFIPSLDEGDIALHALRIPGTSLTQAVEMQLTLENGASSEFPEVERGLREDRHGRDRHRPDAAERRRHLRHAEAARRMARPAQAEGRAGGGRSRSASSDVPGNNYEFTQPIQMRFNELISGVRSDVAVKVFGDDLDTLLRDRRTQVAGGAAAGRRARPTCKVEQVVGPADADRRRSTARRSRATGSSVADVQDVVAIAVGGKAAGLVFEGDRRFELVVRLPEQLRADVEAIEALPIPLPREAPTATACAAASGHVAADAVRYVPLSAVAQHRGRARAEPDQPRERQAARRRHGQRARARPRLVRRRGAERASREQVKLPAGYWIGWGGQFEQLVSATRAAARSSCRSRCC